MNLTKLQSIVGNAIDLFFARDSALLELGVSEWAIAHRLAVYLEPQLSGWNVDCEYNRQGQSVDERLGEVSIKRSTEGKRTRPDIVVHHRGRVEKEHNLLVLELKRGQVGMDYEKSKEFTAPANDKRHFQYRFGLALGIQGSPSLKWFEDGAEVSEASSFE
jgi:hypothetical protein